jgi:cytidylate kinase
VARPLRSPGSMKTTIIAISGRIATGKTTLATQLATSLPAALVRTRRVLELAAEDAAPSRSELQALGRRLDSETAGEWVADAVLSEWGKDQPWIVVDAVRIRGQLDALRKVAPTLHIHLTARESVLAERYHSSDRQPRDYDKVSADPTEMGVDELSAGADLLLDTGGLTVDQVRTRALRAAGLPANDA